jgi:hypothetical protein
LICSMSLAKQRSVSSPSARAPLPADSPWCIPPSGQADCTWRWWPTELKALNGGRPKFVRKGCDLRKQGSVKGALVAVPVGVGVLASRGTQSGQRTPNESDSLPLPIRRPHWCRRDRSVANSESCKSMCEMLLTRYGTAARARA